MPCQVGLSPVFRVRGWRLPCRGVAVVALALPFVLSNAAPAEEQSPAGVSLDFDKKDGTLHIEWSGPIVAGTADDLRAALGKYVGAQNSKHRAGEGAVVGPSKFDHGCGIDSRLLFY
jgi:hypothetical protein